MMGVYIIQAGDPGPVKIGWCKDSYPKKRIAVLQVGCPEELEILYLIHPCARTFEGYLHKMFEKHRIRGEWFTYSQEIKDFIKWHSNLQRDVDALKRRRKQQRIEEAEERIRDREEEREYNKYLQEQEDAYEKEQETMYEEYLKESYASTSG